MTNADMGNPAPSRDYHNYILVTAGLVFALFVFWDHSGPEHASPGASVSSYVGTASQRAKGVPLFQASSAPISARTSSGRPP